MAYLLLIVLSFGVLSCSPQQHVKGSAGGTKVREISGFNPEMRLKLWQLSELPPDQLAAELAKWPQYQKMSPERQQALRQKMQNLRNTMFLMAAAKAREYGLQIPPGEEEAFARKYISRRLEEEKKIWEKMRPLQEKMEASLREEMLNEYGPK